MEFRLELLRRNRDRVGEADALDSLGHFAHRTGRDNKAIDYFQRAITGFRELANVHDEAGSLERPGNVHAETGSQERAVAAWQPAVVRHQAHHRGTDSDRVQRHLASLDHTHSPTFGRRPAPASA